MTSCCSFRGPGYLTFAKLRLTGAGSQILLILVLSLSVEQMVFEADETFSNSA